MIDIEVEHCAHCDGALGEHSAEGVAAQLRTLADEVDRAGLNGAFNSGAELLDRVLDREARSIASALDAGEYADAVAVIDRHRADPDGLIFALGHLGAP